MATYPVAWIGGLIVSSDGGVSLALRNGSSGEIGWTDIMAMAQALEQLHSAEVVVTLTPRGTGGSGGMNIAVDAHFNVLEGSDLPRTVSVSADWPSGKARSELGLVYNLLWQLDYAIEQAYNTMSLKNS